MGFFTDDNGDDHDDDNDYNFLNVKTIDLLQIKYTKVTINIFSEYCL